MIQRTRLIRRLAAAALVAASGGPLYAAGPIVISRGGVYSGDYESVDPRVPAVSIATDEPVVLEKSTVRGPGHLIVAAAQHAKVRIADVVGSSMPIAGRPPGRFASIEGFDRVTIENCRLDGTAGIYLLDYAGGSEPQNGVMIQRNRAVNVDGRYADGKGGWQPKADLVQFVQLDKVRGAARIEIAWNVVLNEPGRSCVEDVISIYLSSGTPETPILIHDNFIRGAYPVDANAAEYSGGGIMLGDGVAKAPVGDPAYVHAYDNVVLDTVNYGIAASAGHHLVIERNRVLSAGTWADGTPIATQNVGIYVWNSYRAPRERFYENGGRENLVGWATPKGRNDWWRPDAAFWTDNRRWDGPLSRDAYESEFARWTDRTAKAGIRVGPGDGADANR